MDFVDTDFNYFDGQNSCQQWLSLSTLNFNECLSFPSQKQWLRNEKNKVWYQNKVSDN
jgi:hypothetical protein